MPVTFARRLHHARLRALVHDAVRRVSIRAGDHVEIELDDPIVREHARLRRPSPATCAPHPWRIGAGSGALDRDPDRRLAGRRATVPPDRAASGARRPSGATRDPRRVPRVRRVARDRVLSARRRSARADGVHGDDGRTSDPRTTSTSSGSEIPRKREVMCRILVVHVGGVHRARPGTAGCRAFHGRRGDRKSAEPGAHPRGRGAARAAAHHVHACPGARPTPFPHPFTARHLGDTSRSAQPSLLRDLRSAHLARPLGPRERIPRANPGLGARAPGASTARASSTSSPCRMPTSGRRAFSPSRRIGDRRST